jgi:cell division protease FtsH
MPIPQQLEPQNKIPPWVSALLFLVMLALLYAMFMLPESAGERRYEIPYSQFKEMVHRGQVVEVRLSGHLAEGRLNSRLPIGPTGQPSALFQTRFPLIEDDSLLPLLEERGVTLQVVREREEGTWAAMLVMLLPWVVFLGLLYWLMQRTSKRMGGGFGGPGGGELQRFLRTPTKEAEIPDITFADVAGQENAKRDVQELVDFLKTPERYLKLGAEVPRGVLLMGAPGTGKTLLAKALAGEAGVPFYSISGSEFIEIYVGVGASRVRNLFKAARANAPSIIFIDELDSVGRTRGTGLGGGHDEREQTLNQILAELDGFEGHEAVIVLAATNRPDVLDPALLRPGRFDRHVTLDLPDMQDRVAVMKVHLRKVAVADNVDLEELAAGTPGFSGADLKNLINEAAMLAARERSERVHGRHFEEARDKLLMGSVRTLAIQPEERHRLAIHEAGHTLVAYFLPHADPLYKVTIIPRGRSLGGTQQLPEEERHTLPEEYLQERLAVILGGRCAEKQLLETVSSGADDDISKATSLARAMVGRWGMSEEVGPVDLRESEEHPFLGREMAQPRRFSEHSAKEVDTAVRKLLLQAEALAEKVITDHLDGLKKLIELLETRETLHREEIEQCLGKRPPRLAEVKGAGSGTQ